MEIQVSQKHCILTPLTPKMDSRETQRLEAEIKNHPNLVVGINLDYVQDCTIDFIKVAKNLKVGFFNIHSDVFSIFNVMNLDKTISLYTTEEDFLNDKRRLLNRKFSVV